MKTTEIKINMKKHTTKIVEEIKGDQSFNDSYESGNNRLRLWSSIDNNPNAGNRSVSVGRKENRRYLHDSEDDEDDDSLHKDEDMDEKKNQNPKILVQQTNSSIAT